MKIFDKDNIINYWDELVLKDVYLKLYKEIRKEILSDLFKEHYSKMIEREFEDDLDSVKIISEE